jgi:hypothetical protein
MVTRRLRVRSEIPRILATDTLWTASVCAMAPRIATRNRTGALS